MIRFSDAKEHVMELDNILVADPVLDYVVLHIERFFRKKSQYSRRIAQVTDVIDHDTLAAGVNLLTRDKSRLFEDIVRTNEQQTPITSMRQFIILTKHHPLRTAHLLYFLRKALQRLGAWFGGRRHGVLVFLMGIDGAGKSTVAAHVTEAGDKGGFFCRISYLGLKATAVQRLRRVLTAQDPREHLAGSSGVADKLARRSTLLSNVFNLLLTVAYIVDYRVRVIPALRFIRRDNTLLVVDRTYYDKLMDLHRWGNSLFYHLLPKPDLVVALDGDVGQFYQRKKEFAIPVLRSTQSKLHSALKYLEAGGIEVLRIDSSLLSPEECADLVLDRIWDIFHD
ncbi:MAG: hypothetical protein AB1744_09235 [Candidatus Zixiibacteriota bacterium]